MASYDELASRIALVRKDVGLSQRAFAEQIGVSHGYLAQVEQGRGKPSLEMLLGIAAHMPSVSRDWLLTGEGEMRSVFKCEPVAASKENSVLNEDVAERQAQELIRLMGLRAIALLSRSGQRANMFQVLLVLVDVYPDYLSVEEIRVHLLQRDFDVNFADLETILLVLEKEGLAQIANGSYRAMSELVDMASHNITDVNEHIREAMRSLTGVILPAVEREMREGLEQASRKAVLATSRIKVPAGTGTPFIQKTIADLHNSWSKLTSVEKGDVVYLVVALACVEGGKNER